MTTDKHTILFDGECNFCSFWVKYVIKRDRKDQFRFAPLQSEIGQRYLKQYEITGLDTVVLIENNNAFIKSTAGLKILKSLGGLRSMMYGFIIVPKFIRDFFYDIIASLRYKLFGQKACELPQNVNYSHKFLV